MSATTQRHEPTRRDYVLGIVMAFDQGFEAAGQDRSVICPYRPDSDEGIAWVEGFRHYDLPGDLGDRMGGGDEGQEGEQL